MDRETETKLMQLEAKIDAIQASVEKTRHYMRIMTYVSIAVIVLPIIGLIIVVPIVLHTLSSAYGGLL